MKILIITPGYLPVPAIKGGAVENLVETIVKENEKEKKLNIDLFSVNNGQEIDTSNINYTSFKFINNQKFIYKIKRIICALVNKIPNIYIGNVYLNEVIKEIKNLDNNYDAVIIENNPYYVLRLKKYFKCPIYLHLHNDYLNSSVNLSKKIYNAYDKIFTVSDFIKDRVKTINKNDKKSITIYNGVDIGNFENNDNLEDKESIRTVYNIKDSDFVLLYTGRLIAEKGVKELIIAFNNICKNKNNMKLLIVGSIDIKTKYIKELFNIARANENIVFTGFIENKNLNKIYQICDVQIIPSINDEALALTAIEGMASKIPLIINEVGGIPETAGKMGAIYTHTNNIINDIEKAVYRIYEDKSLRETLVNNAYQRCYLFTKEEYYKNFINNLTG